MALVASLQIEVQKYASQASQSGSLGEVQRQTQLQAALQLNRATQGAVDARVKRTQAEHGSEVAGQQLRYAWWHYEQKKVDILLQGFHSIVGVFGNISFTSAIVMGFASTMFILQRMNNTSRMYKYVYWTLSMLAIKLLVHSVFCSLLATTDGTKLCYQGTQGQRDVMRAFHGLLALRSRIFWEFVAGFVAFLVLVVFGLWVKLEQDVDGTGNIPASSIVYGVAVSLFVWVVPVVRMFLTYRSVRRTFRITYDRYSPLAGTILDDNQKKGAARPSQFELAVGPQSLRRLAEKQQSPNASPRSMVHSAGGADTSDNVSDALQRETAEDARAARAALQLCGLYGPSDAPFSPIRGQRNSFSTAASPGPASPRSSSASGVSRVSPHGRFEQLPHAEQRRLLALAGKPDPQLYGRRQSRAALFGALPPDVRAAAEERRAREKRDVASLRGDGTSAHS
eukprot:Hpha_TRINITY_DN18798_c0_g1::TRINITY_DN18798_c0_g1_i1::g.47560::m.47560